MTFNLAAIRSGLGVALADVPNVRVLQYVPGGPGPLGGAEDVVVISPADDYVTYQVGAARTSRCEARFKLQAVAPLTDYPSAQIRLDELLSSGVGEHRSLRDAIEGRRGLYGSACDVNVLGARIVTIQAGSEEYLAAELDVQVLARSA